MKKINPKSELLGKTGEKIVINEMSKRGYKVEYSINNFDSEKDLLINGKTAEVKTEQPFVLKNSVTFRKNQLQKCLRVKHLFFVTAPPLINLKYKWGGCLFYVDPKTMKYEFYQTKKNVDMVSIPIEQESVELIRKLNSNEVDELLKYAVSEYIK